MATLGTSKWSIQIDYSDTRDNRTTKTIGGFDLSDDSSTTSTAADTANATTAQEFATELIGLTTNTLNGVSLIRQRYVENG